MRILYQPILYVLGCYMLAGCTPEVNEVRLSYSVRLGVADSDTVSVALRISGLKNESVLLRSYEPQNFMRLSGLEIFDSNGNRIPHDTIETYPGDSKEPLLHYRIVPPNHKEISVVYRVRPGMQIGMKHGRHPTHVSGYLGEDFGLISGRNLFLVPDAPLGSVEVEVKAPSHRKVVSTWPQMPKPSEDIAAFQPRIFETRKPEDLVNGVLGLGKLVTYEEEVEGTPVTIAVYEPWPEQYRLKLARGGFALYRFIANIFDVPIEGPYNLIFTPKHQESPALQLPQPVMEMAEKCGRHRKAAGSR